MGAGWRRLWMAGSSHERFRNRRLLLQACICFVWSCGVAAWPRTLYHVVQACTCLVHHLHTATPCPL